MRDPIERQDAIDASMQGNQTKGKRCAMDLINRQALCEYALNQKDKSVTPNDIMRFPSAQPEIIFCKDCKYWEQEGICEGYCHETELEGIDEDHFCSYAERRES